jgi:hypothetical protein
MRQMCTLLFVLLSVLVKAQTAPTVPASNIRFSSVDGGSFVVAFDIGNGTNRLIVVKEGSAVTGLPANGRDYTANSNFGTAGYEFTNPGEYVIQKSNWNSATVSKLKPGTTYHIAVFEYNGTGINTKYLAIPLPGSKATVVAPDVQTSNGVFSEIIGNSVKLSWTNGNGAGRLIFARKAAAVNAEPEDLKNYQPYNNGEFGTSTAVNGDNYTVYKSSGSSVTVYKLEPNTTYHFTSFEYNGNTTPVYLKPGNAWNVTTNAGPTKPTQTLLFSGIEGNRLTTNSSVGNGSRRLLIARKGAPVTALPVNGTVYTANSVFGSGTEINPGEFVVGSNGGSSFTVTNLEPAAVYYFRIIEYDITGDNHPYYLNTPLDANRSTAIAPSTVASNLVVKNITGSTAAVSYTNGGGSYHMAVIKEGSAVDAIPQDLVMYPGNSNFGQGTELTPGNYSIAGQMNGSGFSLASLKAGKTYHIAIFDYNGTNHPVYNKTAAITSFYIPLEPTQASTGISQQTRDGDRMRMLWTSGNGGKRIVIARKDNAVSYKPVDGSNYTANGVFGSGTKVAPGEYVVYNSTSNYCDITGLEIGATYYFAVFEYNTSDAGVNDYLISSYPTGSASTLPYPTVQTSGLNASATQGSQATISFTAGNGTTRVIYMKANTPVDVDPGNLATNIGHSTTFGTVQSGSTGNYLVYRTSGSSGSFTVTNLAPNTTYYVGAFEYNGSSAPAYLTPASSYSFTTIDLPGATTPTVAASAPIISGVDGNKLTLKWTNGNGTNRIVVMRANNAVNFTPASATNYTANSAFGNGTNLGSDQYVVYNGAGGSVAVTNLQPATTYHLTVFEYNGTGTLQRYLTTSVLAATGATSAAPTVAASNAVASTSANSMTLNWTNGNGENRLVVVKKGSNVLAAPADLSVYPANAAFRTGSQIAIDEYVVYAGTGSNVTVTGLTAGDVYYYKVFEYNGSAAPVYNTSAVLSGSAATGTLPVTWLYVNATQKSDRVVLTWGTSAEMNSAYFIVERSSNGIEFKEAGRVEASNNSVVDQHYSFNDVVTAGQKLYYRLKQTDKDGTYNYSKMVSVQTEGQATARLQPNPVQQNFRVQLPDNTQKAMLAIYNAAGILVHKQTINNMQQVHVQQLSAGIYYLNIQQGNKQFSLKMVKQ